MLRKNLYEFAQANFVLLLPRFQSPFYFLYSF